MNGQDRFHKLVACFAPTVGVERSEEVVRAAARETGVDVTDLSEQGALSILRVLSRHAGIVGIAARFATSRRAQLPVLSTPPVTTPAVSEPSRTGVHRRELLALLEGAMDPAEVGSLLDEAWRAVGISGDRCPAERVTTVLDALVQRGGRLAVAATFAKARWHLRSR